MAFEIENIGLSQRRCTRKGAPTQIASSPLPTMVPIAVPRSASAWTEVRVGSHCGPMAP